MHGGVSVSRMGSSVHGVRGEYESRGRCILRINTGELANVVALDNYSLQ